MRHVILFSALLIGIAISATSAQAQCYADYKAKQDNPLRLHYGVMELRGDCKRGPATSEVAKRLSGQGWTLLNVMGVFGPEGLNSRKASAGQYFLRF